MDVESRKRKTVQWRRRRFLCLFKDSMQSTRAICVFTNNLQRASRGNDQVSFKSFTLVRSINFLSTRGVRYPFALKTKKKNLSFQAFRPTLEYKHSLGVGHKMSRDIYYPSYGCCRNFRSDSFSSLPSSSDMQHSVRHEPDRHFLPTLATVTDSPVRRHNL